MQFKASQIVFLAAALGQSATAIAVPANPSFLVSRQDPDTTGAKLVAKVTFFEGKDCSGASSGPLGIGGVNGGNSRLSPDLGLGGQTEVADGGLGDFASFIASTGKQFSVARLDFLDSAFFACEVDACLVGHNCQDGTVVPFFTEDQDSEGTTHCKVAPPGEHFDKYFVNC